MKLEEIFSTAHSELRPRSTIPEIKVEFFAFAGLNHTARFLDGRLMIRISDLFIDAPAEIYHSLALILLAKLYRKKVDRSHHRAYRTFILSRDIQERARIARTNRRRLTRAARPRGRYVDLESLFERLNERYFSGSIQKPAISWSIKRSRYVLGRYDATHQTIFISRLFDAPNIPPYVIEYVMFHEMLHVKHDCRIHNLRMIVHSSEFKAEERKFEHYYEAKGWLKGL